MKYVQYFSFSIGLLFLTHLSFSQCSNQLNTGTPTAVSTCYDFDAATATSGSSSCTGSGFGGSGTFRIIRFCTGATGACNVFDFSGLNGADGTNINLYSGCSGASTLTGFITGSCYSNSTNVVFSTAGLGLAPNTCYYLRVWTKNTPSTNSILCAYTQTPPNDFCSGATPIGGTAQSTDNYCMTAGTAGDPPASQYCAGSLENNAWFSFTVSPGCSFPCSVVVTFASIQCNGGAAGFQIGYWTGVCGALTNIGCTSGSGGTVTATITNLSPGQVVYVGLDGNAGAYCSFNISATNVVPVPLSVGLLNFDGKVENSGINLDWTTLTESNNQYFTLEKSTDGVNFTKIMTMSGALNSNKTTHYAYTDDRPEFGSNIYRLSQTDTDGTTTMLKVINVDYSVMFENLTVFPNPVNGKATISYNAISNVLTEITIKDISGKIMHSSSLLSDKGMNNVIFDSSPLKSGVYFLSLRSNDEVREIKFAK